MVKMTTRSKCAITWTCQFELVLGVVVLCLVGPGLWHPWRYRKPGAGRDHCGRGIRHDQEFRQDLQRCDGKSATGELGR